MADETTQSGAESAADNKLYVARQADLDVLSEQWTAALGGEARAVLITGVLGSGKRALVGELCRGAAGSVDDLILWRVAFHEEEDGLQTTIRMYAALLSALHRAPALRARVESALNEQLASKSKRVQGWYQAFIEALKKGAPKAGEDQFQVILPRDNPLIGLVEVVAGVASRFPILAELQGLHHVHSLAVHAALEGLLVEAKARPGTRLLTLLSMEPVDEAAKAWMSLPLLDMLNRRDADLAKLAISPWEGGDVDRYLASRSLSADGAALARIADGRPGFVAELVDWLVAEDRLGEDLSELTMAGVADTAPDADELEDDEEEAEPKEGETKRKKATAADAERVAYLAALLGLSFPSGLLADMAGYDRDSVDDLLDATEDLYKELQFSQPLGTWIYQFHKALLRESVLVRHTSEEDRAIAQRVGMFIERFLAPRGYAYLIKAMRLYAESGAPNRAAVLRSNALSNDQPQVWAMAQDISRYFDKIEWPDPLRRTVYMQLLERMVQNGDVNQTEGLYNEAMGWATARTDRPFQAWLLFAGSRLDLRRQDVYRSRDRANDAIKLYRALGDKGKEAEVRSHLAMVELQDGNPNAALDQVRLGEELAPVPGIQAHAEYVRGLVARRDSKAATQAIEHFRKANEVAGGANLAPLALESGLALGETLLASGQPSKAADVLTQVSRMGAQLRNPVRERAATALLAQAQAALKNFEAAIQAGSRVLQLTRELKFTRLEAVDLYNLAFFNLQVGHATEAVSLFRQARKGADATDANFQKELLFHLGVALVQIGERGEAERALSAALKPSNDAKDWRKVLEINKTLSDLAVARNDRKAARAFLETAVKAAEASDQKEERKALVRKLKQIDG